MKMNWIRAGAGRSERYFAYLAMTMVGLGVWWFATAGLAARLAWDGQAPLFMSAAYLHPEWFPRDFPGGMLELLKSAPMMLYPLADAAGIPLLTVMKAMIALEVVLLAGASCWAARRINQRVADIAIPLVAILMVAGGMRMADIGRWGDPTYGWVYGFAHAGLIVGVGAALQKRLVLAAAALAFTFVCHPILGVLGCMFVAALLIVDWRSLVWRHAFMGLAIFLLVAGGWFAFIASSSHLGDGGIPQSLYVAITRMESAHWYPVSQGLFWDRHWERLFPFLAETLLLLAYLPDADGRFRGDNLRLAVGFAVMLVLTAIGVCVSVWYPSPFLVKLALQRASSVYLLIALFVIVPGLWRDLTQGGAWRRLFAALTFMSAFLLNYGVPVAFALALAAGPALSGMRGRVPVPRTWLILLVSAVLVALLIIYSVAGVADWSNSQYWGLSGMPVSRLLLVLAFAGAVTVAWRRPVARSALFFCGLALLAIALMRANDAFRRDPGLRATAEDYLDLQLWARKNTPVGALFMPDPTHAYGWRDFSMRPSFGNEREWFYSGWAYNSNRKVLIDGTSRLQALGLDLDRYLAMPANGEARMIEDMRKRYYALDDKDLRNLSRRFGISYFVFDRMLRKAPLSYPTAYSNGHFLLVHVPAGS
jgi:hypothetical protein